MSEENAKKNDVEEIPEATEKKTADSSTQEVESNVDEFGLTPEEYQREYETLSLEQFKEIKQKSLKAEGFREKLHLAQADFQNYQKRISRDKENWNHLAKIQLLSSLLKIVDTFDRALESAEKSNEFKPLFEGLKLTYQDIDKFFNEFEVTELDATGKAFDANLHEAMMQQESSEHEPGTIITVFQKGYMLKDRLIRPAKVIVAKKPAEK